MKKILIPILTTAAMAPVVATSISCGSTIKLIYEEGGVVTGLKTKELDYKQYKKYTFSANLSDVPDDVFTSTWENNRLDFICYEESGSAIYVDEKSVNVKLNGVELKKGSTSDSGVWVFQNNGISIIPTGIWKQTDKLLITIAWRTSDTKISEITLHAEDATK